MFPGDAFEQVADPAPLLLLRVGQQQQIFGSGHVVVHCPRRGFKQIANITLTVITPNSSHSGVVDGPKFYTNSRLGVLTLAWHNDFLLSVQVIFVALGVAAAALEGRRGPEHVPQGPSAGLTAGGEVVQSQDELVTLVADVGGTITVRHGLHDQLLFTLNLAFIGIQDLGKGKGKGS